MHVEILSGKPLPHAITWWEGSFVRPPPGQPWGHEMTAEDIVPRHEPESSAKADISFEKYFELSITMYSRSEYMTEFPRNEGKINQQRKSQPLQNSAA